MGEEILTQLLSGQIDPLTLSQWLRGEAVSNYKYTFRGYSKFCMF